MSLQENWNVAIPPDTAQVGRQILDEHDPYRLVGEQVNSFLTLADFAAFYDDLGRGGICPIILALVTVFQFLENIPDRVAAQWVRTRLDWKYALHLPLAAPGFHYADLCNFRQRLLAHHAERVIFERVLQWVRALGFLKRHGQQRTDSTHMLGGVERMSRLELAWETLRVTLRALQAAAPTWYAAVIPAAFAEVYAQRQSDWRLSKDEVPAALQRAGQDGFWLLARLAQPPAASVRDLPEVAVLTTVWAQQFEQAAGRTVVRQPPITGTEVVTNPHDPDARWSKKRRTEWVGYKLQVTETAEAAVPRPPADSPGPGGENPPPPPPPAAPGGSPPVHFITDIDISAANAGDSEALPAIQARLIARDLQPIEQTVDQAYVSGPNLAHSQTLGIELVGPAPEPPGNKLAGYRQADFTVDWTAQTVTCPAGLTTTQWHAAPAPEAPTDPQRQEITVRFGAVCRLCPLRAACQPSREGRVLVFSAFHAELSARRAEQTTPKFKARLRRRAGIEGTLFGLVRAHGARRARYRGTAKVRLQALFIGAAANLKRLARALVARAQSQRQVQVEVGVSC